MSQYIPQISSQSLQDKVVLITGKFRFSTFFLLLPAPSSFDHSHVGLPCCPLPGGANGIGASLVQKCLESDANVCFGDLDNIAGERLLRKCQEQFHTQEAAQSPRIVFQTTDVTNYQSVLALFDYAFKTYKRIDHVVSAAGIVEIGNWFDFGLTLQTVREVSLLCCAEPCISSSCSSKQQNGRHPRQN
jgi:hypothetical protein